MDSDATSPTILIVEDDPTLQRVLKDNFEFKGYRVAGAVDGEQGLSSALTIKPDIIVLDIMLPKVNGYELCRRVRQAGLAMPIIMLTAKGQESDIVLGLNLGADDYVTKPFGINELLARCHAFLRRRDMEVATIHRFGDFELDLPSHRLLKNGSEVALTPKEFAVLALLVGRRGRAFTRDEILKSAWGFDVFVTRRSVDRCISTLREKIEENPQRPRFVKTVREIGYRFDYP